MNIRNKPLTAFLLTLLMTCQALTCASCKANNNIKNVPEVIGDDVSQFDSNRIYLGKQYSEAGQYSFDFDIGSITYSEDGVTALAELTTPDNSDPLYSSLNIEYQLTKYDWNGDVLWSIDGKDMTRDSEQCKCGNVTPINIDNEVFLICDTYSTQTNAGEQIIYKVDSQTGNLTEMSENNFDSLLVMPEGYYLYNLECNIRRRGSGGKNNLICVYTFTPVASNPNIGKAVNS